MNPACHVIQPKRMDLKYRTNTDLNNLKKELLQIVGFLNSMNSLFKEEMTYKEEYQARTIRGMVKNLTFISQNMNSIAIMTSEEFEAIHDDFKGVITEERYGELVGRHSVMRGTIGYSTEGLAIEGIDFEFLERGSAHAGS